MSSFSHCPQCQQPVAIPDGADPTARVRCPHCHAEFSLSDTSADRTDGPRDVILVVPPPTEAPLEAGLPGVISPIEIPLQAGQAEETAPGQTLSDAGPSAESAPDAGPSAEAMPAAMAMDETVAAEAATIQASPATALLEREALDLAQEASGLQNRAEGLQVTAHTSDLQPEAATAQAEELDGEAEALAAKVEAMADPAETLDAPTARPATVAGTYRAMGGALIATADALDAVAQVLQHKGIASQPHESEQTPVAELESDLAAALGFDDLRDEKPQEDEAIPLELPEPSLGDEAPLPISDADPFFADAENVATEPSAEEPTAEELSFLDPTFAEPAAAEPTASELSFTEPASAEPTPSEPAFAEPAALEPAVSELSFTEPEASPSTPSEPTFAEPAATEPMATELSFTEPTATESAPTEPVVTEAAAPAESPVVGSGSLLLKAVNLRSKAEALRARGQGLLTKADALAVASDVPEASGEDEEGDYAFHGDWAGAELGQAAVGATAAGGTAMPFPITPRKQKKAKNPVRELISVVAGGFTGLALTYLILVLVSVQYDYFGICPKWFPHIMKSESTTPAATDKAKVSKNAKPVVPGHAGSGNQKATPSPVAAGQGVQAAKLAQGGPAKPPAGELAPLVSLPESKPASLDASSGDSVPTTLASDDALPGAMIIPPKSESPKAAEPAAMAPKAEEPKSEEKPAEAAPGPPSGDAEFGNVVDVLKPPAYGSDKLGWALKNAHDSFQGDLKPENYSQLCRLAEVLTFVDPQKGVTNLADQKAAVEKLLRDVGERDKHKNVKVIAQLAAKWLDNPARDNPGVLLAGRVQKIGKTGQGMTIVVIGLAKPDKNLPTERPIKMLSREPLDLHEKDAVVVLGGLGVGGQGDHKELVVIHGMTVKFAVPPPKPK